jgi:transposase
MPADAVLLFEDETIVRLFPVLRRAWSLSGESAAVSISGRNDKRVLFGTINLRTGHRILLSQPAIRQDCFQAFLRLLRRSYRGRPVWLLVDRASAHTAPQSLAVAKALNIRLVWLPKQCPELNAMDHLWKTVKANISANYQFSTIDEHVSFMQDYILKLTNHQALRRAGILSKNFWLKSFFK